MKHTTGKVTIVNDSTQQAFQHALYDYDNAELAVVWGRTEEQSKANAELIADAFNTTNKTGYTPGQLAEQKAVLLAACQMAKEELVFGGDWRTATSVIESAIKAATTPKA